MKKLVLLGVASLASVSLSFGKTYNIKDEDKAFVEAASKEKLIAYVLG